MRSSRARQTTDVSVEENPDRTGRGSQVSEFSPPEGDVVEEDVGNGLSQQNQNLLDVVRQELQRSLEANTRELTERFKGRFAHLERKVEIKETGVQIQREREAFR